MPKTRNITRSQWDSANASSATTHNRSENAKVDESEKENVGRQGTRATRSHTRSLGLAGLSGPSTTLLPGASRAGKAMGEKIETRGKAPSKGKGKPTAAPLKRKKLPLQDITDQFLPAPEAANRGEEDPDAGDDATPDDQETMNRVAATISLTPGAVPPPKFTSPLPPSSPPSESTASPSPKPLQSAPKLLEAFVLASKSSVPHEEHDPWQEFDNDHAASEDLPRKASSNSDPFGFVSVERKLKAEREPVASIVPNPDTDDDDDVHILVADTSSPRQVRRLKRSQQSDTEQHQLPAFLPAHPHFVTPPTPHKDKQKRRRLSHEGRDIFSPCSSSIDSSPSPSKVSARKRPRPDSHEDPLGEFNEKLDRSYEVEISPKKAKSTIVVAGDNEDNKSGVASRFLRSRDKRRIPEEKGLEENTEYKHSQKGKGTKKPVKKSRPAPSKKKEQRAGSDEEDDQEKWDLERQERLDYFKRLEDYHIEREDVYLI